jgi:thiamine pyrophosphokinase
LRSIIIANGRLQQPVSIAPDDLLIAADGGALHCLELGLHPDYVIGDLDSLAEGDLEALKAQGAEIISHDPRKDFTDLELALQHALELGSEEIIILAALGERWDQTIANLLLPSIETSALIRLIDGAQEISYLRGIGRLEIHGHPGDIVSLIPLAGNARGVTTKNLEYPLSQEELLFGRTRGISNVLLTETAEISLEEGLLLCTVTHLK